jgi:geranylgeranyl pyrophosphate synthase
MSTPAANQLNTFLKLCRERCDQQMENRLVALTAMPPRLVEAMRYSTLLGGKRIRPCLAYAAAKALGAPMSAADDAACAVEMMHCYSLIHDDLPAMDNDDLRRGKPTLHKAYDEATAILAGDALQSLAIQILSEHKGNDPVTVVNMINILTAASGCFGMIAGQALDTGAVGRQLTQSELETMHRLKTGALICASVELGALSAGCRAPQIMEALQVYARNIGLAFQVHDDVLDVVAETGTLGKKQGADIALNKPTYVSLLGLDGAREKATALIQAAKDALSPIPGDTAMLSSIADYVTQRAY